MKRVRDFMKKDVVYFSPEDSIFDVAKLLAELDISGGPVLNKNRVVGIVTLSDIIKHITLKSSKVSKVIDGVRNVVNPGLSWLILALIAMGKDELEFKKELKKIKSSKIKNVMTKKVVSIHPDASLLEAAAMMEKHDVNRLPVINEKGSLCGIVARTDLIKAVIE